MATTKPSVSQNRQRPARIYQRKPGPLQNDPRPRAERKRDPNVMAWRWNILRGWGCPVSYRDPSRGMSLHHGITMDLAVVVGGSPFDPLQGTAAVRICGCPVLVPLALVRATDPKTWYSSWREV